MKMSELAEAIDLELRHLEEAAGRIRAGIDGDVAPITAARLLVALDEISEELLGLVDSLPSGGGKR